MALPFPHPKYHIHPHNKIFETISPILEEYDPVTGFIDSVGEIRQSVETEYDVDVEASGLGEHRRSNENAEDDAREDSGIDGVNGFGEQEWRGYVVQRESGVRSSIKRERDAGRARAEEGGAGMRKRRRGS